MPCPPFTGAHRRRGGARRLSSRAALPRRAQCLEHFDLGPVRPGVGWTARWGGQGALAIGAGGRALEKHGLVRAARLGNMSGLMALGGEGRTITIAAYLPASACL